MYKMLTNKKADNNQEFNKVVKNNPALLKNQSTTSKAIKNREEETVYHTRKIQYQNNRGDNK